MKIKELTGYQLEDIKKMRSKHVVSIEEKIDAFYIHVKMLYPGNRIEISRRNHQVLTQKDFILNRMWQSCSVDLYSEIAKAREETKKFFAGYEFGMFYFPVDTPLRTSYLSGHPKFLISKIYDSESHDVINRFKENGEDWNKLVDLFLKNVDDFLMFNPMSKEFVDILNKDHSLKDWKFETICKLCWKEFPGALLSRDPEGFILRTANRKIYQIKNPDGKYLFKSDMNSRVSFEIILNTFVKFIETSSDNYQDMIGKNYVKSVCNLFERFIEYIEKNKELEKYFIGEEDIKNPYVGYEGGLNVEMIPSMKTRNLCQENKIYANVFKILLANLCQKKKYEQMYVMTEAAIQKWNELAAIMKSISQ